MPTNKNPNLFDHSALPMSLSTVRQLNQINREFYEAQAETFAQSRNYYWPSWHTYWERSQWSQIARERQPTVWDVGCGNGRLWQFLHDHGWCGRYVGWDTSAAMLRQAHQMVAEPLTVQQTLADKQIIWQQADLVQMLVDLNADSSHDFSAHDWPQNQEEKFDIIAVFGLWHHLPSAWLRRQALEYLVSKLHAGGELWLTIWQPMTCGLSKPAAVLPSQTQWANEPWISELEPGDEFLGWGRSRSQRPQFSQRVSSSGGRISGGQYSGDQHSSGHFSRGEFASGQFSSGQLRYVHWLDEVEEAHLFSTTVASISISWQRWCETQTGERGNICYLGKRE